MEKKIRVESSKCFRALAAASFALLLAFSLSSLFAERAFAAESGTAGNCTWELDDNGTLTVAPIEGTDGKLAHYYGYSSVPWYEHRSDIKRAVIEEGVSAVSAAYMFYDCSSLESLDLSGLDTSNATNMRSMFYDCSSLESLDLSGLDTSNVTSLESIFRGCSSLESLDLSTWDVSEVTCLGYMFSGCSSLESLDLSSWDVSDVTIMYSAFYDCSSLVSLDVSSWNVSKITSLRYVFYNCSSLASLNVSGWDVSGVEDMHSAFSDCSSLESLDLSSWDTSKVQDMGFMFSDCSSIESLDVSGWDTSKVQDVGFMFSGCSSLESLDISGWDTSKVQDMRSMFRSCSSLEPLDVSGFDTSSATSMNSMFSGCSSLESLDVSGWDTSKVQDMNSMFQQCYLLRSLDLSSWNTSRVNDMAGMFWSSYSLEKLSLGASCQLEGVNLRTAFGPWRWQAVGSGTEQRPEGERFDSGEAMLSAHSALGAAETYVVAPERIGYPTANQDLVYSGELQSGVARQTGFVWSGDLSATAAGSYGAVATLEDGYAWPDGTTDPKTVTWVISPADISVVGGLSIGEQAHTGFAVEPVLFLAFNGSTLVNGEDYEVAYEDNVEIGSAKVIVSGKGNFTGNIELPFEIIPSKLWMTFPDVKKEVEKAGGPEKVWYVSDGWLDYVVNADLMGGYSSNGWFGPYDNITRGQVAVILYRSECAKDPSLIERFGSTTDPGKYASECEFRDMCANEYYTAAVNWAKAVGIMTGDADTSHTTVRPNDSVARQELCLMLARYANGGTVPSTELDPTKAAGVKGMDKIAGWARDGVYWAVNNGVIGGVSNGDGTFSMDPTGKTWRSAAAKMFTVVMRDVIG